MSRERGAGLRRLVVEAVANAAARPALSIGLVLISAGSFTGTAVAEINAATSARGYERELISAGYATLLVEQDNPAGNTLSTGTCRTLGAIEGVHASVALRDPEPFALWATGGPVVPVRTASAEIITFLRIVDQRWSNGWSTAQTFVDTESFAASPTDRQFPLRLVDGAGARAETQARSATLTALGAGSAGNIVTIDPTPGPVAACALYVNNPARDLVVRSIDAALPALGGFSQRWALPSAERFETPRHRFEHRASQYYWATTALAMCVLTLLHLRLRRGDHALYAIAGLDRSRIWALATLELASVLVSAFAISAIVVALAARRQGIPAAAADVGWASLIRVAIATTLSVIVLTHAAARRSATSTLDAIKDR